MRCPRILILSEEYACVREEGHGDLHLALLQQPFFPEGIGGPTDLATITVTWEVP